VLRGDSQADPDHDAGALKCLRVVLTPPSDDLNPTTGEDRDRLRL
jgi:hypothetical protein